MSNEAAPLAFSSVFQSAKEPEPIPDTSVLTANELRQSRVDQTDKLAQSRADPIDKLAAQSRADLTDKLAASIMADDVDAALLHDDEDDTEFYLQMKSVIDSREVLQRDLEAERREKARLLQQQKKISMLWDKVKVDTKMAELQSKRK
eukprot:TRINITY_DN964_c0_g1_i1.p4 TRINITY_DN964_c0_g1~~TRINITY_DN964_c0_g1_i1.p4  ORF type:complete len:148 (+),score=48.03 TRINITY_DN964_c0_g1_i1:439-882(+)